MFVHILFRLNTGFQREDKISVTMQGNIRQVHFFSLTFIYTQKSSEIFCDVVASSSYIVGNDYFAIKGSVLN